jgi:hypothetical protein
MLILPVFLSPSVCDKQANPVPFATVAMAGHVTPLGYYCECGSSRDCICEPWEQNVMTAPHQPTSDTNAATFNKESANGIDPGAGVMLLALTVLFALRLRF